MVRQTPLFYVYVHVLLAPPSVLGAWSKALVLWLPIHDADFTVHYFRFLLLAVLAVDLEGCRGNKSDVFWSQLQSVKHLNGCGVTGGHMTCR